ncbi:hypothetical protein ABIC08_009005, partial [Bradyrhizobium sp. RT9b]|uniref:hypothetical protein n=1 Tax=Bradyrhizobium sp. RT9b TaxID=3156385 RepID=UPI0033975C9A
SIVSTLAEDDSSNGANRSTHKQSDGPRSPAYVLTVKRLAKLLDITVQAASQAAEQLVERKILVDGPAMPATAYSLLLMRYRLSTVRSVKIRFFLTCRRDDHRPDDDQHGRPLSSGLFGPIANGAPGE